MDDAGGRALGWRRLLLLALVSLALFLPGFFSLPPVDRDEARFAQASKQMIESGDFVDIRFQDEPRHKKPAGIYWLQSAAAMLLGRGADSEIWAYRLPSLAGAVLSVLLTAATGARLFGARTGAAAAMLLAGAILLGVEARLAKTDAVLLACILAAQLALARVWMERHGTPPAPSNLLPFWLAIGAGILVKGPIILLACGGTALLLSLWERSGRWLLRLRPGLGLPVACLVVLPWLVAIALESDGAFFSASVGQDLLGKVLTGQESHGAPPGYYAVAVWLTFWPASLLLFLALPWIWMHRREDAVRFCLAWILPLWIVFELVMTKLPHYVLPAYPALALLAARALADGLPAPGPATAAGRWGRRLRRVVAPVWLALAVTLCAALIVLSLKLDPDDLHVPVLGAVAVIGASALVLWQLRRGRHDVLPSLLLLPPLGLAWLGYEGTLRPTAALWPSANVAELVAEVRTTCPTALVASAGYREPSLVFLLGTGTVLTDGAGAAAHLGSGPCALALVEQREEPAFKAALSRADPPETIGRVVGVNYSNGRSVDLTLYGAAR